MVLALFIFCGIAVSPAQGQKSVALNTADKTSIIGTIFDDLKIYMKYRFEGTEKSPVIVSTENIDPKWLPKRVGDVGLLIRTSDEIQRESGALEDYFVFGRIEFKSSIASVQVDYFSKNRGDDEPIKTTVIYLLKKFGKKWKYISREHPGAEFGP